MHPLISLVPPFQALLGVCRGEMDGKKQHQQFLVFVGDKTLSKMDRWSVSVENFLCFSESHFTVRTRD